MAIHVYRSPFAILAALLIAALAPAPGHAAGPAFDCADARTADEKAICADPYLSALDWTYSDAFDWAGTLVGREAALPTARKTLRLRATCGSDGTCIERVYLQSIAAFAGMGAEPEIPRRADHVGEPLPYVVGACSRTNITWIGSRLMGDDTFDTGTSVRYANGGIQVSYDYEAPLIASQPGDPVELCLRFIPQDCPPGDMRGRIYETRNLRTGGVWVMPDAQHRCGGA